MVSCSVLSCSAQLVSVFFAGCQILSDSDLQVKILKLHQLWRTALLLSQNCCLVFHTNFVSCQVSFVLYRCFYQSTLVVCAVARTVSRSVYMSFDLYWSFGFIEISSLTPSTRSKIQKKKLFWFHTRLSKVHFCSTEGQRFYWSIMTAVDSVKCRCVNSGMAGQVGGFQNRGVCLQAFSTFLPHPSQLFYLRHFSHGLWLLFLILCS